jgi:hypothetical protein
MASIGEPHRSGGRQGLGGVASGGLLLTGVGGDSAPHRQCYAQRDVAAQLQCPLHRLVGDRGGLGEVGPPDLHQDGLPRYEHQVALLAVFTALAPDGPHLVVRLVEASGPRQQLSVVHTRLQRERDVGGAVLQLHRTVDTGLIEAIAANEAHESPHRQRLTEQLRLTQSGGVSDRNRCAVRG